MAFQLLKMNGLASRFRIWQHIAQICYFSMLISKMLLIRSIDQIKLRTMEADIAFQWLKTAGLAVRLRIWQNNCAHLLFQPANLQNIANIQYRPIKVEDNGGWADMAFQGLKMTGLASRCRIWQHICFFSLLISKPMLISSIDQLLGLKWMTMDDWPIWLFNGSN